MECRPGCGACCIAASLNQPFFGMPQGKPAGVPCVHLSEDRRCRIFTDPRRPAACANFRAEPAVCGDSTEQALAKLLLLETATRPSIEK